MKDGIYLAQSKYTRELVNGDQLVKKFGNKEGQPVTMPMGINSKLSKDETRKKVDITEY